MGPSNLFIFAAALLSPSLYLGDTRHPSQYKSDTEKHPAKATLRKPVPPSGSKTQKRKTRLAQKAARRRNRR